MTIRPHVHLFTQVDHTKILTSSCGSWIEDPKPAGIQASKRTSCGSG